MPPNTLDTLEVASTVGKISVCVDIGMTVARGMTMEASSASISSCARYSSGTRKPPESGTLIE
jgi:hypothetical protein